MRCPTVVRALNRKCGLSCARRLRSSASVASWRICCSRRLRSSRSWAMRSESRRRAASCARPSSSRVSSDSRRRPAVIGPHASATCGDSTVGRRIEDGGAGLCQPGAQLRSRHDDAGGRRRASDRPGPRVSATCERGFHRRRTAVSDAVFGVAPCRATRPSAAEARRSRDDAARRGRRMSPRPGAAAERRARSPSRATTNRATARGSHAPPRSCQRSSGTRTPAKRASDIAHQQQQRDGLLEEQVRQGKPVVLVQDRQREGQRRMVPEQLDPPGLVAFVTAEVQRRHREDGERDDPDAAPSDRLAARHEQKEGGQRREAARQQPEREVRGHWVAAKRGRHVHHRGDEAERVGNEDGQTREATAHGRLATVEQRVHDDRRQEAERAERYGDQHRAGGGASHQPRAERHERADVPDDARDAGEERQTSDPRRPRPALAGMLVPDHDDEHHVEGGACQEPQHVHEHPRDRRGHTPIVMSASLGARFLSTTGRERPTTGRLCTVNRRRSAGEAAVRQHPPKAGAGDHQDHERHDERRRPGPVAAKVDAGQASGGARPKRLVPCTPAP